MQDENKTLWNKTSDDITVGDAYTIMAIESAAMLGIGAILIGGLYGIGKVIERRAFRKAEKKKSEQEEPAK